MRVRREPSAAMPWILAPLVAVTTCVNAASTKEQIEAQYEEAKTKLKADRETAKGKCNRLTGGERRICKDTADSQYEAAMKDVKTTRDKELSESGG